MKAALFAVRAMTFGSLSGDTVASLELRQGRRRLAGSSASYRGLSPASVQASEIKRRNRSTDTKHERVLRDELWRLGLRYRKNSTHLIGKPDLVFMLARVAVFCDGDFWHGRQWTQLQEKLSKGHNQQYWCSKIAANRSRDRRVSRTLRRQGWKVIRVWETDIQKDPARIASAIMKTIQSRLSARDR